MPRSTVGETLTVGGPNAHGRWTKRECGGDLLDDLDDFHHIDGLHARVAAVGPPERHPRWRPIVIIITATATTTTMITSIISDHLRLFGRRLGHRPRDQRRGRVRGETRASGGGRPALGRPGPHYYYNRRTAQRSCEAIRHG